MARFIDADALIRILNAKADMAMGTAKVVFFSVAKMVDYLPAADVAPRAEVAQEIFEGIREIFVHRTLHSVNSLDEIAGDLDELLKRYGAGPDKPREQV